MRGGVNRKEGNVCNGIPKLLIVSDKSGGRIVEAIGLMTREGIESGIEEEKRQCLHVLP